MARLVWGLYQKLLKESHAFLNGLTVFGVRTSIDQDGGLKACVEDPTNRLVRSEGMSFVNRFDWIVINKRLQPGACCVKCIQIYDPGIHDGGPDSPRV